MPSANGCWVNVSLSALNQRYCFTNSWFGFKNYVKNSILVVEKENEWTDWVNFIGSTEKKSTPQNLNSVAGSSCVVSTGIEAIRK